MREVLPGLYHWTTLHEGIGSEVSSYYLPELRVLIDPREPVEGVEALRPLGAPAHVLLTSRLHFRHSDRFRAAFGCDIACHRAGLGDFSPADAVRGFVPGDALPGGIRALEVGALCPDETALLLPIAGAALALGDAVIRDAPDAELSFVPPAFMGDDPAAVEAGLRRALRRILEEETFEHLLLAHGPPCPRGGRALLARFIAAD